MVQDRFPGGENIDLLFNSDIVNFLLETNRGERQKAFFFSLFFFIYSLKCSNCQWVGGGGLRQKVIFRAS